MRNKYYYEINSHTHCKAFVIILFGGQYPAWIGMVPSCIVRDFGLGYRNVVDESVVDEILIATDKSFENYDERLKLSVGDSSDNALAVAKHIEKRDNWKVLYDRNGYPLMALLRDDYDSVARYFVNDKYLDEKVAWYLTADSVSGIPDSALWPGV